MSAVKSIHPFPARMAPELALNALKKIRPNSVVLDPMVGSGTVIRQAVELGHPAIGFDMDPLAVLMTKAWTTPVDLSVLDKIYEDVIDRATNIKVREISLPWIDEDTETENFISYWFSDPQLTDLRRLAYALDNLSKFRLPEKKAAADLLKVAFSRLIITKDAGASLARDVSHSRPHKVVDQTSYDVFINFERSYNFLRKLIEKSPPPGGASVNLGDARNLTSLESSSVDVIITSPPYLNAIDYMRGHRMSLVWLGHSISNLRQIRSNSIGSERGPNYNNKIEAIENIENAMGNVGKLPNRYRGMIGRYAGDVYDMMSEVARLLRPEGKGIFVVGNSCLKDVFIKNSEAIVAAGKIVGLSVVEQFERDLPEAKRYLPMPKTSKAALGKRMRTETVLTLKHT